MRKPKWKLYFEEGVGYHLDPRPGYKEMLAADCEFNAALKLYRAWGTHFRFRNLQNGQVYMMQNSDIYDLLQNHMLIKGHVAGRFGFVKRGRVLSIKLVRELTEEEEELLDHAT